MVDETTLTEPRDHTAKTTRKRGPRQSAPLVSLVLAGLNEAPIIERNLKTLCDYMEALDPPLSWELVFVNDGSTDATGDIVEAFARTRPNVRVLHHERNRGLGQALRTAFVACRGDYVVCLDADLAYGPEHIPELIAKIRESGAKIVATSPYMKGGRVSKVPWLRAFLSRWSNRFLTLVAKGNMSTMTAMVRAYDRRFLESLDLRSTGMDINIEILFKGMILNEPIAEIPSHLDWSLQQEDGGGRTSKMRIVRHTFEVLFSGFLLRPVLFFVVPGLCFLLMSLWTNFWLVVRVVKQYGELGHLNPAVAAAFDAAPHTFVIGGLTLIIAIQLIGLGILALQSTHYFEESFHLGTTVLKNQRRTLKDKG